MDAFAASRLSPLPAPEGLHLEQVRQAQLLAAIRNGQSLPPGWVGHPAGLSAHQRHARVAARRALAAAYPALARWIGVAGFDELAWWHWRRSPPSHGDLGTWGGALPQALVRRRMPGASALAGLACLEWAVHLAERAPDPSSGPPAGLEALRTTAPASLRLLPWPGLSVLRVGRPLLARWEEAQMAPAPARTGSAVEGGEPAQAADTGDGWVLVRRQGMRVVVRPLRADQARFTRRLLAGHSLGRALTEAAPDHFEHWLRDALAEGWWRAVSLVAPGGLHDKDKA